MVDIGWSIYNVGVGFTLAAFGIACVGIAASLFSKDFHRGKMDALMWKWFLVLGVTGFVMQVAGAAAALR